MSRNVRVAALVLMVAMLAIAATGFCVFDADDHQGHHGRVAPDLCAGMLATTFVVLMTALVVVETAAAAAPLFAPSTIRFVLTPPPKPSV